MCWKHILVHHIVLSQIVKIAFQGQSGTSHRCGFKFNPSSTSLCFRLLFSLCATWMDWLLLLLLSDCCDASDEYNSHSRCQNSCRWVHAKLKIEHVKVALLSPKSKSLMRDLCHGICEMCFKVCFEQFDKNAAFCLSELSSSLGDR